MNNDNYIIEAKKLSKVFKVHIRDREGMLSALSSLFFRQYDYVNAAKEINLGIIQGTIRGLIGPNGAGKSTLIKMLTGILFPTSGSINIMGLNPWSDRIKYVNNIGVLFGQKSQLIWELPAIDTYSYYRKMYTIPIDSYKDTLKYFTNLLNIKDVITKPVRNLSLGERMKCELVCALLHNPKIVYLDEPTIGIDVTAKQSIRNMIKKVNKDRNTTFIISTHDLYEIENLCDEITVLNNGSVIYNGTLEKLRMLSSKKKVEITFFNKADKNKVVKMWNLNQTMNNTIKFDLDVTKYSYKETIIYLLQNFAIKDINLSSINIETVIEAIYNQK